MKGHGVVGSKLLDSIWKRREHNIHKRKLREVKPSVDTAQPMKYKHLKRKQKKEQMLEDRYTEIEREN